jgi:hypothetical protein
MSDKKIIRVAVGKDAKEVIERIASEHGMTEVAVASRIYEWFGRQRDEVKRGILGMYGDRGKQVAEEVLKDMAAGQRRRTSA